MALSHSLVRHVNVGSQRGKLLRTTLDSSYPTGGWAFTAASLGMSVLRSVLFSQPAADGYVFAWDRTNAKLKGYRVAGTNAAMGQIPAGTDLSTTVLDLFITGH